MKRRVVAVFLSLAMVAALATGCGNSGKEASGTSSDTKTESTNDKESVFIQPITSMPASLQHGAGRDRPDARPAAGGFPAEPHRGADER